MDSENSEFSILSISADSLYWGEKVTISVNANIDSTDDVKLFIGSVRCTIDSIRDNKIYIIIAEPTTTAQLRLYRNDILTAGDQRINILERRYDTQPTILGTSPSPLQGFIGDIIVISGSNMPLRRRGVAIEVGEALADILTMDSNVITIRIAPHCTSGHIVLFANQDTTSVGEFKLLERGTGKFLPGDLNYAVLTAAKLWGTETFNQTVSDRVFDRTLYVNTLYSNNVIRRRDSLFMHLSRAMPADSFSFECSLKIHETGNMVSGRIEMVRFSYARGTPVQRARIEVHEMNWYRRHSDYVLYARGSEVSDHLREFFFNVTGPSPSEVSYKGSTAASVFELRLKPTS